MRFRISPINCLLLLVQSFFDRPSHIYLLLLKVWAAAEGRDLSSVAFQCLETGIREMQSKGSIPSVAINRYDSACQKRIALAEVNNLLEKYEIAQNELK